MATATISYLPKLDGSVKDTSEFNWFGAMLVKDIIL